MSVHVQFGGRLTSFEYTGRKKKKLSITLQKHVKCIYWVTYCLLKSLRLDQPPTNLQTMTTPTVKHNSFCAHFKSSSPTTSHNRPQLMHCRLDTKMSLADLYHTVKYCAALGAGEIYSRKSAGNIPFGARTGKKPKAGFHASTYTDTKHDLGRMFTCSCMDDYVLE